MIKDVSFYLNTYDICVANKDIDGKRCTIAWYIEDNKVSRVDQDLINYFIIKVEGKFTGLMVTKGNMHTLLGIKISIEHRQS